MPSGFPNNGINKGWFKKGQISLVKGKHWNLSKEHKRKIKEKMKGNKHTLGKHWKLSEETKKKMSKTKKDYPSKSEFQRGEEHPFWMGGTSKYPLEWTDDLRESIRKRDNFICQECGIHQEELDGWHKKLDVHHIDYDKDNLNPNNLISLCKSCHIKTNYNREYWEKYFNN